VTDPLDQPETEGYALAVPFVVCASQGGPFDDDAFVAGFQAGEIDKTLTVAAAAGANRATFTVRTTLVRQAELLAMNRGFPAMTTVECDETPEWTLMTFEAAA
jgi:hypothetical protein